MAARANYLGVDRPDLQFAVKQVSRMASPSEAEINRAKRIARDIQAVPKFVPTIVGRAQRGERVWRFCILP